MKEGNKSLRVAYAIQNVGGIDFTSDIGDTVPVKQTLTGLRDAGHEVTCMILRGQEVIGIEDIRQVDKTWILPLKWTGSRPFKSFESGVRRLQSAELNIPYYALFDFIRFYDACAGVLPTYTLCHEHNGLFAGGAALASARLGIPYILTVSADPFHEHAFMGKPIKGLQGQVAAREARYTYTVAKKILCVSEPAKKNLVENWNVNPEKIIVQPNGVDIDLFNPDYDPRPVKESLGLASEPVIAFVGGFQPWHGLDRLVESFSLLLQAVPNAKLLLIGDGRARPLVDQKIEEMGVKESVFITGFIPQAKVPKMLAAADVAVIPYPRLPQELWFSPLKLYEYMASGKAIVASKAGQIARVIQSGKNGLLVEPGDVKALAEAITSLLKSPTERERLGERARLDAVNQHSWKQYIERLEAVYRSVL